uniref:Uncharacterized protein n=1 Tax=Aegilops tauschii subsp. strangulata TaxID=200361 RepID=A0A453I1M7_AEGTS
DLCLQSVVVSFCYIDQRKPTVDRRKSPAIKGSQPHSRVPTPSLVSPSHSPDSDPDPFSCVSSLLCTQLLHQTFLSLPYRARIPLDALVFVPSLHLPLPPTSATILSLSPSAGAEQLVFDGSWPGSGGA